MSYQMTRVQERNVTQNETPATKDRAKFGVSCKAGGVTTLTTTADSLAIEASVRISRSNVMELWPCVGIYSREEEDGSLGVQIVAFHPNWEEPMQIAYFRSPLQDASPSSAALECNLEHKSARRSAQSAR
jgi:hypothetical protein